MLQLDIQCLIGLLVKAQRNQTVYNNYHAVCSDSY